MNDGHAYRVARRAYHPRRKKRFNLNRAQVVDENFVDFVRGWASASRGLGPNAHSDEATKRRSDEDHRGVAVSGSIAQAEARGSGGMDVKVDRLVVPGIGMSARDAIELFESQTISRHIDIAARQMRARNEGFYTIGSSGHEGNAILGRLTRYTDVAFLHYRSGAFMAERARKVPGIDFVRDTMLGIAASSLDPTAGGRHKIWGSAELWAPPQTSTVGSHLPKAVGTALALSRVQRFKMSCPVPLDTIAVCSFGDAAVNHATAQTAFNMAASAAHQRLPVPILFVCEDNGLGISVDTPAGWIESQFRTRHGLTYFQADGLDLANTHRITSEAVDYCRSRRRPVFLHLRVVRLLGHAGSDPETEYHTWEQIDATEAKDPLIATARLLLERGVMTSSEILDLYERVRQRVRRAADSAATAPKLASAEEIIEPLVVGAPDKADVEARRPPEHVRRIRVFGDEDRLPERGVPRHMAALINLGLRDAMIKYPEAILFGEDVAKKGGVYHVTAGLSADFGVGRVFNTILDETTILALGIGAAHLGLLPIPEIQYLAYYHNAEDQIRGEACSLPYYSNGKLHNPMVVRIAGWAYQKGFGGHFHNDNSIAALRDVPGLVICSPARGDDAVKMLRTCLAMAKVDGRVIAFIEPIALYMMKDLYEPKDAKWCFPYPPPNESIPFGEGAVYRPEPRAECNPPGGGARANSQGATQLPAPEHAVYEPCASAGEVDWAIDPAQRDDGTKGRRDEQRRAGSTRRAKEPAVSAKRAVPGANHTADDLTIITFANGVYLSLRAARSLLEQHGIRARVVDLRWLNPLNEAFIIEQALATARVLIVDEGRKTGGINEAIMAILYEHCGDRVRAARLTGHDTYIPLGPAADLVLPGEKDIITAALGLLAVPSSTISG